MTQRVLVTGGGGFVGRHVVADLTARADAEVIVVMHRWENRRTLDEVVGPGVVHRCIHLGWYADPADYLTASEGNIDSLQRSLELADWLGGRSCRHLTVAGTCAEYAPLSRPMVETDEVAPWSAYGATKASFRMMLSSSFCPPGIEVAWARLFNLTGPGESPMRLIPLVVLALLRGHDVALSPGRQVRDYLDVADVASALVDLSTTKASGAFNVSSAEGMELCQLLGRIGDRLGRRELLRFGSRPYGPHDAPLVVGDNSSLRRVTSWKRRYDTEAMIDRVIEYWKRSETRDPS